MSLSSRTVAGALLLAFALLPLRASADPVQITSGLLTSSGALMSGDFQLVGEGFDVTGFAEPGVVFPSLTCFPCTVGDPIDLRTRYLGTIGNLSGTVDGTTYSSIRFGGSMEFQAPTVPAPSTAGAFTLTRTFTFDSTLTGFLNFNTENEEIAFEKLLAGQGTVTASFVAVPNPDGPPLFNFESVRYEFTQATPGPDPVPEPATLLLFGSGLAAALRYRKKPRL